MTRLAAALLVTLTAGCGAPDGDDTPAGRSDTRQVPTNTTPGVHVSGHVNVGVARNF